jgi:hypothetical protein
MHKHTAVTALAIALNITMLAPAVSASSYCSSPLIRGNYNRCGCQCWLDAVRRPVWNFHLRMDDKKWQACISACVNAVEASRR